MWFLNLSGRCGAVSKSVSHRLLLKRFISYSVQSFVNGKYVVSKIPTYVREVVLLKRLSYLIICLQLWFIPSAMADILIAVTMTWLVRVHPFEFSSSLTEILLDS